MADITQTFSDPNFQGLALPEKIKVMKTLDPNFAGLPLEEQGRAAVKLFLGGDSSQKLLSDAINTKTQVEKGPPVPSRTAESITQNKILTPQEIEARTSGRGYAQPTMPSHAGVMETLNAPIDYLGDIAGKQVQSWIDPVKNPTLSDIGGGLTKAAIQYAGPQGLSTIARLGAKAAVGSRVFGGTQGGRMESLIGKTQGALESGLGEAQTKENWLRRMANLSANDTSPLPNTSSVIEDIIGHATSHKITDSPSAKDARRLQDLIKENPRQALSWINDELTAAGKKTGSVEGATPQDYKNYKRIFAGLAQDMENRQPQLLGQHTEYRQPSVSTIGTPASKENIKTGVYTDWGKPTTTQVGQKEFVTTQTNPPYSTQNYDIKTTTPGVQANITNWENPQQKNLTKDVYLPRTQSQIINPGTTRQVEDIATPARTGQAWMDMRHAERTRLGWKDVTDQFNDLVNTKRGMSGAKDINANKLLDSINRDQFLRDSLGPEGLKEVGPLLEKLANTAALPAPRGVGFGSGKAAGKGALVGGLASLVGGPAVGASVALGYTGLDYGVGHLLMTERGRSVIKAVLNAKMYEPSQQLNIINGMGRLAEKGISDAQRASQ